MKGGDQLILVKGGDQLILFQYWTSLGRVQHPPDVLGVGLAQLHAELGTGQVRVRRTDLRDYHFAWIRRRIHFRVGLCWGGFGSPAHDTFNCVAGSSGSIALYFLQGRVYSTKCSKGSVIVE